MKKLTVLLLVVSTLSFGQGTIGFNASLDNKLTFIGDDKGNDPFTLDITAKFLLQGFERQISYKVSGYTQLGTKYEFADLKGGEFHRYGVELGYTLLYNDFNVGLMPFVGYGFISRENSGMTRSWEFGATAHYKIVRGVKVITSMIATERTDIKTKFVFNFNTGIQIEI